MSNWRTDVDPPKDRAFLAFGKPTDIEGCRWLAPGVHLAYWDEIDSSYCIKGATWKGPFIEPEAWKEEPEPFLSKAQSHKPNEGQIDE